ncbi:MAG TPA: methyltransferase domain-containing protein [Vicinamibacterales bacterium]
MTDSRLQPQIDAAEAYEALMGPALFGEWAEKVADAARIAPNERVLDVACGTGILTRAAAARAGTAGLVAGLDPGPGMLEVARRLAPAVTWREGVAESLPFSDDAFDAVVSQFGLMFFSDRPAALREMLRVLTPGGRLAIAVWDALDRIPAYAAEVALLERLAGRQAADALRAPFALGDRDALARLVEQSGVTDVRVSTDRGTARFPSVRVMVEADLRGWLPVVGIVLPEDLIARILDEAGDVLVPYTRADGSVAFDTSAHIVTGIAPPARA